MENDRTESYMGEQKITLCMVLVAGDDEAPFPAVHSWIFLIDPKCFESFARRCFWFLCARMVTCVSKSLPVCFSALCVPSGVFFLITFLSCVFVYADAKQPPFRQRVRLRMFCKRLDKQFPNSCNLRLLRWGKLHSFSFPQAVIQVVSY